MASVLEIALNVCLHIAACHAFGNYMRSTSTNCLKHRAPGMSIQRGRPSPFRRCLHVAALSKAACNALYSSIGLLKNVHGTRHPAAAQLQCLCGHLLEITAQAQRCSLHVTRSTFTCGTCSLASIDRHDVKGLRALLYLLKLLLTDCKRLFQVNNLAALSRHRPGTAVAVPKHIQFPQRRGTIPLQWKLPWTSNACRLFQMGAGCTFGHHWCHHLVSLAQNGW
mmetsp:Transcript_52918/g.105145  ORF Transcript_52918/g.105145 Transcript_52918/m.105145 type:complete len:223 (-) Transcript_52918:690-1358(-)